MIVAIHQPNYLPYLGFFHKMAKSDVFVLYDTAQYSKNEFHNRNRIKTPRGGQLLTVPVRRGGPEPLAQVEISRERPWAAQHLKTLEANYSRAPYFHNLEPDLASILSRDWSLLADLNSQLVGRIAQWLSLSARIVRASTLPQPPTDDPTEKLIHYTRSVGGSTYLSGPGGRNYLKEAMFKDIRLEYTVYNPRPYRQMFGDFVPNLSVVDALFNTGESAAELL